jgi:6-phosphogluconate dehydrogenase (decarboxylating)
MKIAVLGAGLMGRPMAERLKAAGHAVQVYNRTREKIADLSKAGIDIAKGPEDAVRDAACVILMLADVEAIRDVLLRSPARKELHGRAVIQMGTIGPRESQSIQKEVVAAGGNYLEAPVLGSLAEVRAGKADRHGRGDLRAIDLLVRHAPLLRPGAAFDRPGGTGGRAQAGSQSTHRRRDRRLRAQSGTD